MRKSFLFKTKIIVSLFILVTTISCTKEAINEDADPIVGKWFLTTINDVDVSDNDCYSASFIDSDASEITIFIQNLLENGDCEILLNNTDALEIRDGFYYLGSEALEFYIDGNQLTWIVDTEATLKFKK